MADSPATEGVPRSAMRVFLLRAPGDLRLESVEVPQPADGEVLARVSVALTCGTDIKTFQRGHARLPMPGPLGHEWAGRVAAVGAGVRGIAVGDRVVATPTAPCGDCAYCLQGQENLCLHLFEHTALGAFGDFILVPRHIVNRNLYPIPGEVSDLDAAFLEPLACVVHGAGLVPLSGRTVAFLGDGPIALLFLQVARLRGANRTVLIGRHRERLGAARRVGADWVIDAGRDDPLAPLREITDGLGADTVVECVGRPESWREAVSLVRRGGEVLLFGGCEKGAEVSLDTGQIHYDEIALKGGFHYTPASVRGAWELIVAGNLELDALVTARMDLERLPDALDLVLRREAVKVAIVP